MTTTTSSFSVATIVPSASGPLRSFDHADLLNDERGFGCQGDSGMSLAGCIRLGTKPWRMLPQPSQSTFGAHIYVKIREKLVIGADALFSPMLRA